MEPKGGEKEKKKVNQKPHDDIRTLCLHPLYSHNASPPQKSSLGPRGGGLCRNRWWLLLQLQIILSQWEQDANSLGHEQEASAWRQTGSGGRTLSHIQRTKIHLDPSSWCQVCSARSLPQVCCSEAPTSVSSAHPNTGRRG